LSSCLDWTSLQIYHGSPEETDTEQERQQRAAEDHGISIFSIVHPRTDVCTARLSGILMMYPRLRTTLEEAGRDRNLTSISSESFIAGKERLLIIDAILREYGKAIDEEARRTFIRTVLDTDDLKKVVSAVLGSSASQSWFRSLFPVFGDDRSRLEDKVRGVRNDARRMDDAEFLALLPALVDLDPLLTETGANLGRLALDHLRAAVKLTAATLWHRTKSIQEADMRKKNALEFAHVKAQALLEAHQGYLDSVDGVFLTLDKR
jgi:hypothetical protein